MNCQKLANMQNMGRAGMNRAALKDIRNVAVDSTAPPIQRLAKFMEEIQNPYLFRVGDSVVQLGWADRGETLQTQLAELFRLQCQTLV